MTWPIVFSEQGNWVEIIETIYFDLRGRNGFADHDQAGYSVLATAAPFVMSSMRSELMYQRANHNRFQIFSTLVLPIAIGLGLFILLGLLIDKEVLTNDLLVRYLVGHPISKCTTLLFLIGVVALLMIANNVFDQFCSCNKIALDLEQPENTARRVDVVKQVSMAAQADGLLDQLQQYKWTVKTQYLWNRLASALSFIQRTDSTAGIEDELKYLSDMDRDRQHHRYSLVRILIWATPMLGFLGTVLGISQALGGIQVGADNDFQQMLNSLRGSLFVAFDTTALALTLSILLMFLQFFIERFESQLLDIVDRRAHEELSPIYSNSPPADPQAKAIQEVGAVLLAGANKVMQQQTALWERSLQSSQAALTKAVAGAHESVQENLRESITEAANHISKTIAQSTRSVDDQMNERFVSWQKILAKNADNMSTRWEQWQVMLSGNARQLAQSQELVSEQLHLTREVLGGMTLIQKQLREGANSSIEKGEVIEPAAVELAVTEPTQDETSPTVEEPTLRVIPYEQAASRLHHIYRFVTKPADISDAA